MAGPDKIATLRAKADEAGVGPGNLEAVVNGIYGFATNSGRSWTDRLSDEQCDEMITLFARKIVEAL